MPRQRIPRTVLPFQDQGKLMRSSRFLPVFALVALAAAVALTARPAAAAVHGFDTASLDTTCSPCRDFFQFANGGWLARTPIPAAYSSWGSFDELHDRNQAALHQLLDAAVADVAAKPGTNAAKLGIFYGTGMDSAAAETQGAHPLDPQLQRIAALGSAAALAPEVARLHGEGVRALFAFGSQQDAKNSEEVIAFAGQGGLGLPDRDYYLRPDSTSQRTRAEYVAHIARTLALLGDPPDGARDAADRIMALETAIARAAMTLVQQRDPRAVYHRLKLAELKKLCPSFDWTAYLREVGLAKVADLNVRQPDYFPALDSLLRAVPLGDWKDYLRWQVARTGSPWLASAFVNEDFRFQQVLSGAKELLPRWKRCLRATDQAMGEALGEEYVKRYFTPETKSRALEMVKNLEAALQDRIGALSWMSDTTRAQALGKLRAFGLKIGYPDRWRDYSKLQVAPGPFLANLIRANRFERDRRLAKIGRPVDRREWNMSPPTVNAYYSSSLNEIVFPAGILQPPFYDPLADDAVNYGGIGAVIGHEMTHGFDDRGRQFDARGNLRDWWTPADAARYKERAQKVIEQFDGYVAVDTLHVNGRLTTGENIADLGGLTVAYAAFQKSLAGRPRPAPVDGFTPEQRFFLGWAQVWRENTRPEAMRTQVQTDPHSPPLWRVNGPLSNLPEFARAFGCKAGDAMVRPDSLRTQIW